MEKEYSVELSIIIPTIGRKKELRNLFDSILFTDINVSYEVIVVDQNENHLIDEVCENYKKRLPITQYTVQFKGLSRAKNYGVTKANGKIVCFPDDDAEFCKETVSKALYTLRKKKADCVFGKTIDKETRKDTVIKYQPYAKFLSINDFEGAFIEATMFAYVELLIKYPFDENMGAGTICGAEEGYDLVYRLLLDKKVIYYEPTIIYYHPNQIGKRVSEKEIKRAFYYSCGFGHLCKKHKFVKKYKRRVTKLLFGIPIIAIIRRKELKYFMAQWMGLRLGYKYI